MSVDLVLSNISQAHALLLAARNAPEAKRIADLAKAAEIYAKRQKLSDEIVQHAHAIRVDAITLMGQFLQAMEKNKGGGDGSNQHQRATPSLKAGVAPKDSSPPLANAGITYKESSSAQALADVAKKKPELHAKVRAGQVTIKAAVRAVRQEEVKAKKKEIVIELQRKAKAADERFRVDHADCLKWFAAQPADSLHLVFGSPPYEQARLYLENGDDIGIARDTRAWVEWMVKVYKAALRCCTGLVAFVVDSQTKDYRWSAAPARLMTALDDEGITLRKPPIYHRVGIPGSGGPDWLRNDYEFIVCATRGGQLPWSENTAMGEPCAYGPGGDPSHRMQDGSRVNGNGDGRASMMDRNNLGPHKARQQNGRIYQPPEIANPGNVIHCKVGGGAMGNPLAHENEAPFPELLAEFFIRSFCAPGGIVCDPFSGSGTTGAVAVRNGRRFLGCDIRESQTQLSCRRIGE